MARGTGGKQVAQGRGELEGMTCNKGIWSFITKPPIKFYVSYYSKNLMKSSIIVFKPKFLKAIVSFFPSVFMTTPSPNAG